MGARHRGREPAGDHRLEAGLSAALSVEILAEQSSPAVQDDLERVQLALMRGLSIEESLSRYGWRLAD